MDSIVTLTMNPALDITTDAEVVRPTDKIRCSGAFYDAGGGGINVAKIAHVPRRVGVGRLSRRRRQW